MKFFSFNVCYFNHHKSLNVSGMKKSFIILCVILFAESLCCNVYAQSDFGEPIIQEAIKPKNLFDEGYKRGFGFALGISDFGFGVGMQYRIGLSSYTEGLINFKIAGLRDPSEQTYIDPYFSTRIIPGKYKRVLTFPTTIGVKKRLFASNVTDNFRVFTSMNFGPSISVSIPYFNDRNNNGYRDYIYNSEQINDIFQGWGDAEMELGWNGEVALGIDFGDNFKRISSLKFGYSFYYFKKGLQMLEPKKLITSQNNLENQLVDANDAIHYFGTAQITFTFGKMYK